MIQDSKIFAILLCLLARGDGDMPIKSFQIGAWTIGRNKGTILSLTLFPIRHRGHSKLCRIIVAKRPVTLKKQTKKVAHTVKHRQTLQLYWPSGSIHLKSGKNHKDALRVFGLRK